MQDMLKSTFGTARPVIGMIHFPPIPGTPLFDERAGLDGIVTSVRADLEALQAGGIDAVMFGNEGDRPYQTQAGLETVATMASVISAVRPSIRVPFGWTFCGIPRRPSRWPWRRVRGSSARSLPGSSLVT